MTSRDLSHLEWTTRSHAEQLRDAYNALAGPYEAVIVCTFRGALDQQAAYESGASRRRAGTSFHEVRHPDTGEPHAYAVDWRLRVRATEELLEGKTAFEFSAYEELGIMAEARGWRWGGRWRWKGPDGKLRTDPGHTEAPITLAAARRGETPDWPALEPELPPDEHRPRTALRKREGSCAES